MVSFAKINLAAEKFAQLCEIIKLANNSELHEALEVLFKRKISQESFDLWVQSLPVNFQTAYVNEETNGFIKCFSSGGTYYIFKDYNTIFPRNVRIQQEFFIAAVNEIPKIFLFKVEQAEINVKNIDKTLDQRKYEYLEDYLIMFYNLPPWEIRKIINRDRNKLDSISNNFFEYSPKKLGRGQDGMAFDVGDNRVIKLFSSKFALNKAIEAQNHLFEKSPLGRTEAMIYDAGEIGVVPNTNAHMYYVVMEKMKPIRFIKDPPKDDQEHLTKDKYRVINDIIDAVSAFIESNMLAINGLRGYLVNKKYNVLKQKVTLIKNTILENLDFLYEYKNELDSLEPGLQSNWLDMLVEEIIYKFLTNRTDVQSSNIGINKQNLLRFFDAAFPHP